MRIVPNEDRLIIEPQEEARMTPGGIALPDIGKGRPTRGKVLASGPGAWLAGVGLVPNTIKAGDLVLYGDYSGQQVEIDGKKLVVLRASDVLATLEPEEK